MNDQHYVVIGGGLAAEFEKVCGTYGVCVSLIARIDSVQALDCTAFAQTVVVDATESLEAWLDAARAVDRCKRISRVVAFGEAWQLEAQAVSAALGLPFHSEATVRCVTDKLLMRRALSVADVATIRSMSPSSARDVIRWRAEIDSDVIVKPRRGTGSDGVFKIDREERMGPVWKRASASAERHNDTLIAEEYTPGPIFCVDGLSDEGRHKTVAITQSYYEPGSFVPIGFLCPAVLSQNVAHQISEYVSEVLTALGVAYGPTHTEIVMSRDGPRVLETHLRLGGANIPSLIRASLGVDLQALSFDQILGGLVFDSIPGFVVGTEGLGVNHHAFWYAFSHASGVVSKVVLPSDSHAQVHDLGFVGKVVDAGGPSYSPVAYAHACGPDASRVVGRARCAASQVRVVLDY